MMKKIFVDSDVILDLLAKREPFYPYAAELFSLVDKGKIKAHVSAIIITNLHYVLRKMTNKEQAIKSLQKLRLLVKILPVDEKQLIWLWLPNLKILKILSSTMSPKKMGSIFF